MEARWVRGQWGGKLATLAGVPQSGEPTGKVPGRFGRWRAVPGSQRLFRPALALAALLSVLTGVVVMNPAPAGALACVAAGSTGLSARVVATTGQVISGVTVNASGCDLGIFIGPGTSNVTVSDNTVTGANDHGIFAEDATNITISSNKVTGNGVNPNPAIFDDKAIELVGTSNSTVSGNAVTNNNGGAVGIFDNGPIDSGAPNPGPSAPVSASNDVVALNYISSNTGGCGIVVASHNPGGGVSGISLDENTIEGHPGVFGPRGPDIGGIVVDAPIPHTSVSGVSLSGNTITDAFISGVAIYADAPGAKVSSVQVSGNAMSGNDWGETSGRLALSAVNVIAYPTASPGAAVTGVTVAGNTISGEFYGVWVAYATATSTSGNTISPLPGGRGVFNVPAPASGYWIAATNGGVYSFGESTNFGSLPGMHVTPSSPVVGIAHTIDQGGYWLAGANGAVYAFGEAKYYGSVSGRQLNAPIVGIISTPYRQMVPGAEPSPAGKGYWLVGSDGGIYSFGDAKFYGSMGGKHLNKPIVGMATTPGGHGYWEVASDGGIFSFGTAKFYGSMGGKHLNKPIVAMATTPGGHGYWEVASDGGIFSFGTAKFHGSMGSKQLPAGVHTVDMSAVGVIPWA